MKTTTKEVSPRTQARKAIISAAESYLKDKGIEIDPEVFKKAMAKAGRCISNLYGCQDWLEWAAEIGEERAGYEVADYYIETLKEPSGRNTQNHEINRMLQRSNRGG